MSSFKPENGGRNHSHDRHRGTAGQDYRLPSENGQAEAAYLTVDRLNDGNRFIVKEGLSVGDTIVAEGVGLVREGMSITPKTKRNEPAIFIDRPVFSGVISVVIVLLGMISMFSLPVEQYPDIAPPTINVFATYPGANAETVQKAVITPLEEAINGVEDMTYMTSTASNTGDASINIYFKQGTNADMAAVNVQNRVNGALSQLPAEATKTGVTTEKQQNAELMTFALYSPDDRFDQTFLNNYVKSMSSRG